jgi:chromosome segregation protein
MRSSPSPVTRRGSPQERRPSAVPTPYPSCRRSRSLGRPSGLLERWGRRSSRAAASSRAPRSPDRPSPASTRAASEAAERLTSVQIEAARLEKEREEAAARLPEGEDAAALTEDEAAELRAQVDRLERRREALGQVNPLAAEEHARESERLHELVTQREDLERSLHELEGLRADLTRTVEERFAETYGRVERHFAEVAATLFPGGKARLTMTEGDDEEEAGIEIELQPAGKRITRLSLLSGGEKALGAISFLFALFLARPCPFYLLDEVEAALDDTNIGRFVELLRRYADRAQFIVVTHQKRTMEAGDILYGVTMGGDGVSQVVSKRLAPERAAAA